MSRGIRRFSNPRDFANKRRSNDRSEKLTDVKKAGKLDVWMHTQLLPVQSFCHNIPMPIVFKDKQTNEDVRRIWSKALVCHETIEVLEAQHFHKKDEPLVRKIPPERCGLCKLVEWAWLQCMLYEDTRDSKKKQGIEFTTPMFEFINEDEPNDNLRVHVGGVCNLLNKTQKQNDVQKAAIKKAKIRGDEAFKENFFATNGYITAVVEHEHPSKGVIVSRVGGGLGGSIQEMMDAMLENNRDIQRKPYCMRWKYDKDALPMDKYKSVAMTEMRPSDEILKLIRGPEPRIPDYLTEPFNQATVRAVLEDACVLPKGTVPWEEFFPSKEQTAAWKKEDEEATKREAAAVAGDAEEPNDDEEGSDEDGDDEPEFDEDGDELVECDCGKPMKAKLSECPHCHATFDVEEEEESEEEEEEEPPSEKKPEPKPEPAKKPMKKRSSAKSTAAKRASSSSDGSDQEDDAGIPF